MPYVESDGTYVHTEPFPAVASAARTTTGNSGAAGVEVGSRMGLRSLFLDVTAASGTSPTLNVSVETSSDNTAWYSVGAFAQRTAAGSERKSFAGLDRYVRIAWVIAGTTPSFTFSVAAGELV